MTDRGPDEVRAGHVLSTQAMFGPALRLERDYDLDLWSDRAPRIDHLAMAVAGDEPTPMIKWSGHLPDPGAHSIDQRVKFARWMELFADRGGRLVASGVSASDLDGPHQLGRYDLTVIAAGEENSVSCSCATRPDPRSARRSEPCPWSTYTEWPRTPTT